MTIKEIQEEIIRLKKEKDFCILAHAYQGHEILEVADYMGDSYGLSVEASKDSRKNIIMCGVRFMAETCKILSPDKNVYLPNPEAGCPMAEQMNLETLDEMKKKYPQYLLLRSWRTTRFFLFQIRILETMFKSRCRKRNLHFLTADVLDILRLP